MSNSLEVCTTYVSHSHSKLVLLVELILRIGSTPCSLNCAGKNNNKILDNRNTKTGRKESSFFNEKTTLVVSISILALIHTDTTLSSRVYHFLTRSQRITGSSHSYLYPQLINTTKLATAFINWTSHHPSHIFNSIYI